MCLWDWYPDCRWEQQRAFSCNLFHVKADGWCWCSNRSGCSTTKTKLEQRRRKKQKKHRARVVLNGGNDFAFSCDEKTEKSQKVSLFE